MALKDYRVEVYDANTHQDVEGPWWSVEKNYTLRGARVAARRIVNERGGRVFVDIVDAEIGALVERVVA
jgi:hypothetical protein